MEYTLRLVFESSGGRKINFSYTNVNPEASATQVKTLMQVLIANGDIFAEVPMSIVGAEFIGRQVTPVDVA